MESPWLTTENADLFADLKALADRLNDPEEQDRECREANTRRLWYEAWWLRKFSGAARKAGRYDLMAEFDERLEAVETESGERYG